MKNWPKQESECKVLYKKPELEVIGFNYQDVIATSICDVDCQDDTGCPDFG